MPEFLYLRPTPQPEGQRPLVVLLLSGHQLPAEGKRVESDYHVRMLLRDGDVEVFTPAPKPARVPAKDPAPEAQPTKKHRAARGEEQSE